MFGFGNDSAAERWVNMKRLPQTIIPVTAKILLTVSMSGKEKSPPPPPDWEDC